MFPADFNILNNENDFVVKATINITYSSHPMPDVQDTLSLTRPSDRFQVLYDPSGPVLIVEATRTFRFTTTQEQLRDYLTNVTFSTNDQAPDINRTINIVVEELPLGRGPLVSSRIPVRVAPVNDQPVVSPISDARTTAILTNYLETLNLGFNASFLLTEQDVVDNDRQSRVTEDFIGLAIIEAQTSQSSLGEWQYYSSSGWRTFPSVSYCDPLYVPPSRRIRLSPFPNFNKESGSASINYLVWDGSSQDSPCSPSNLGGEY